MSSRFSKSVRAVFVSTLLTLAGAATASDDFATIDPEGGGSVSDTYFVALTDWQEQLNVEERLEPLGDDLMGDQIDPHTGAVGFTHTDIRLPGNSDLDVALVRRIKQGVNFGSSEVEFGDWEYVVPRLVIATAEQRPWTGNRCTDSFATQFPNINVVVANSPYEPPTYATFRRSDYTTPLTLEVGGSSEQVLENPRGAPWPSNASHVTNSNWHFTCLGNSAFLGHAPDGKTYRFDRHIVRDALPMAAANLTAQIRDIRRDTHILAATQVSDQHGNWVRYTYDSSGRLTRIHANDGREITLSYSGTSQLVQSATAHGRTWTYSYRPHTLIGDTAPWQPPEYQSPSVDVLSSVTLPDGRSWTLNLDAMLYENPPSAGCLGPGPTSMSLTHPSGARGEFTVQRLAHRYTYDNRTDIYIAGHCPIFELSLPGGGGTPTFVDDVAAPIIGVTRKDLIAPSAPTATWVFDYEEDLVGQTSLNDPTNWTRITGPSHHATVYHNWRDVPFGGAHVRTEIRETASSPILQSGTTAYVDLGRFGDPNTFIGFGGQSFETKPRRPTLTTATRDGVTYSVERTYDVDPLSSTYSWGAPTQIRRFSTLSSEERTVLVDYRHDTTNWVLSLPETVTRNGRVFEDVTYNAVNRPTTIRHFGVTAETRSYNADGTLAWVRDGLNRQTSFASYYRGFPRTITQADASQITLTVNDSGWLTSITDARGTTTGYSYTASGWLSLINRPTGFADTTISYSQLGAGVVATSTTGSLRTVTDHDHFHRPIRVERRAIANGGGSIFTRMEYDAAGRMVFESFPSASSNPTTGTTTSYDALGRVTQTAENVAPFATTTTDYLSSNRTRVTDPMGNVTVSWASGYGSPSDGNTIRIDHPLGLTTTMTYDIWGNITRARQYGTHSGFSVDETQTWTYDSRNRLCRHVTPETGATQYFYNNANELTAEARGQSATAGCYTAATNQRTNYGYDQLGRMTSINYPDASPDVSMSYDANGNLVTANRGISAWTYTYDAMNQLTQERLVVDGRTYTTQHGYYADGRVSSTLTPANRLIEFLPDGHGRPTTLRYGAATYANSGTYHPSGQLQSINYSNGLSYSASFNSRQQMTDLTVARTGFNALDYSYNYDANGRVTNITDHAVSGQNRAFTYDGLGRLSTASGPWGAGSYTYDLLNNIRSKTLGADTVEIQYNANNQISRARDTRDGNIWRNYIHDARGNVTSNNRIGFSYDRSDQPVTMWGIASGSYAYDAHNRRVKQVINGETIYSVYGLDGTLRYRDNATTGGSVDYLFMGGRAVVRVNRDVAGGPLSTSYIHHDHLGSSASATNSVGNILWREHYTPFGETLNNPAGNADDTGFTGHIRDTATSLTYAQARYYDPAIGRFLSSDPVGFAEGGTGYFNRYAYTFNDPVNHTDPTGMYAKPDHIQDQINQDTTQAVMDDPEGSIDAGLAVLEGALIAGDIVLGGPQGEGIVPAMGVRGLRQSLKNSADDAGEAAASTLTPGPYARESVPATSGRADAGAQRAVNGIGDRNGCHTCGTRESGRQSGNWTADHQPPNALNPPGGAQRFYPHCARCSARQGAEVRNARRNAAPPPPPRRP